jgi:NAD(P)-dependent dehydrogenase (short-subunit alcohol dehydrogenase family)
MWTAKERSRTQERPFATFGRIEPSPSIPRRLDGRRVLITGAGSGIGRATAVRVAGEGADVGAVGLDRDALTSLADEVGALGRRCAVADADVADADAITAAVDGIAEALGGLDVVHANAGVQRAPTDLGDVDVADWERVLAVNLTGVFLTFQAGVAHLRRRGGGLLLATGSSLAIRPGVGTLPYAAAKAGVHALARSLALELAPESIRVNVVAPGLADTPMTRDIPGYVERALPSVPLGEPVDADAVAALAVHLMTDDARHITGSVFTIDGGRTAV